MMHGGMAWSCGSSETAVDLPMSALRAVATRPDVSSAELTALRERVRELEEAIQWKADFAAALSHDLRTPLTVIVGYLSLLLDGTFGNVSGEQRDTLRRVEHSARSLIELVNATLDLSRQDSGRVPVHTETVSVPGLLGEIELECRDSFAMHGMALRVEMVGAVSLLSTDRLKLKMILKNLLGNAAKFAPPGEVRLSATEIDGGVEFAVSDSGMGIPPEALALVFEPFRQARGDRRGVGLGLYIVRRLAELLNGRIRVESSVGQGTTFRVWMPPPPK